MGEDEEVMLLGLMDRKAKWARQEFYTKCLRHQYRHGHGISFMTR